MISKCMLITFSVSTHASQRIVDTEPEVIMQKGTRGELPCRVDISVALLFWYKGPRLSGAQTIIIMDAQTKQKEGDGYSSGHYDVGGNFSLIINEVNVEDNDNFYCEISELETGSPFNNRTSVVVFGKFDIL